MPYSSIGLGWTFVSFVRRNSAEDCKVKHQMKIGAIDTTLCSIVVASALLIMLGAFDSVKRRKTRAETEKRLPAIAAKSVSAFLLTVSGVCIVLEVCAGRFKSLSLLNPPTMFLAGVFALAPKLTSVLRLVTPEIPVEKDTCSASLKHDSTSQTVFQFDFDEFDHFGFSAATLFAFLYNVTGHWILNNLFAIVLAYNYLVRVRPGCVAIAGSVAALYSVCGLYWMGFIGVSHAVTDGFPFKFMFPGCSPGDGACGTYFVVLGLGDVVVPGLFMAALLRYDVSKGTDSKLYFTVSLAAYEASLVLAYALAAATGIALPTQVFVIPACVYAPLIVAMNNGELHLLCFYTEPTSKSQEQGCNANPDETDQEDELWIDDCEIVPTEENDETDQGEVRQPGVSEEDESSFVFL